MPSKQVEDVYNARRASGEIDARGRPIKRPEIERASCPCCGAKPEVKIGGPGCAWIKCRCGMETTDGSLPRVVAIWNTRQRMEG